MFLHYFEWDPRRVALRPYLKHTQYQVIHYLPYSFRPNVHGLRALYTHYRASSGVVKNIKLYIYIPVGVIGNLPVAYVCRLLHALYNSETTASLVYKYEQPIFPENSVQNCI